MRLSPDASQAWRTVFIDWISALPEVYRQRCTPSAACPEGFEWRPVSSLDTNVNSVNSIFVITDKYSKGVRLRACHKSCHNVRVPLFYGPYRVVAVEGSKVFVQRERDTIAVSRKDLKPYISPYESTLEQL